MPTPTPGFKYQYGFPIRVPPEMLEELGAFTGQSWSDSLSLEPYVREAIRLYMNPPPAPGPTQPAASSEAGYQWKQVFLPDGTRLRASFDQKYYFATVEDGEIRYDGGTLSPSGFANLQGSGNRNAWKAIWLLLPDSGAWLLADTYRSARKLAIARLLEGDEQPDHRHAEVPLRQPTKNETQAPARRPAAGAANVRVASAPGPAASQSSERQADTGLLRALTVQHATPKTPNQPAPNRPGSRRHGPDRTSVYLAALGRWMPAVVCT